MAESVDALVSNTSGATHPGSIPGLGTKRKSRDAFPLLLYILLAKIMVRQAQRKTYGSAAKSGLTYKL